MTSAAELLERLASRRQTVTVAESLTGGAFTATLTEVPGASRVVRAGLVVYATDTKASVAGVDRALLERAGPVAADVANALARGARSVGQSTYGIGITGVAGPDPQEGHPVGEVHIAVATPDAVIVRSYDLAGAGGRHQIRSATCVAALGLLDEVSRELPA